MKLRAESVLMALQLQESGDAMTSGDTRGCLQDAVREMNKGTDSYGYLMDHFGDDESGDAVYSSGGDTVQAPYSITGGNGFARKATIDTANAMKVKGRMVYEPTQDEGDHYAAMSEAFKAAKIYTEVPVYERFVSKPERDAAGEDDFAGKGKSFPILKREDVMAAVRSIGRAGSENSSSADIKAKIIAIAKRKGWTDELPKAWKVKAAESQRPANTAGLKLVESAPSFIGDIKISEAARTSYPVLLITPGKGSTGHYSREVLKSAADAGKFKPGTLMFWNHATAAEEAQRPEGNLDNLAAILTGGGVWNDNGASGPGVYGEAKPMADYAAKVESRAPHIGLSIRAGGTGTGKLIEGVPELKSIDYVESVDYVTKAGRGGKALVEAARDAGILDLTEGGLTEMDAAEIKTLKESMAAQVAINERLVKRALRGDAIELAGAVLGSTALNEAQRKYVTESVVGTVDAPRELPVKEGGVLDAVKFTEAVNAEAKRFVAALPVGGNVIGMGAGPQRVQESAEQITARESREKREAESDLDSLTRLMGGDKKLAESAARKVA